MPCLPTTTTRTWMIKKGMQILFHLKMRQFCRGRYSSVELLLIAPSPIFIDNEIGGVYCGQRKGMLEDLAAPRLKVIH